MANTRFAALPLHLGIGDDMLHLEFTDFLNRPPMGPFTAGFIVQHLGWRWVYWIMAAVS
jgi:hypothetical protein